MAKNVSEHLRDVIKQLGDEIIDSPKRLEGILRDLCPEQKRDIELVLAALHLQIVRDLRRMPAPLSRDNLNTLSLRLQDEKGYAETYASWAIRAWATALRMPITGDSYPPQSKVKGKSSLDYEQREDELSSKEKDLHRELEEAEHRRIVQDFLLTVSANPLRAATGADILDIYYHAWANAIPPKSPRWHHESDPNSFASFVEHVSRGVLLLLPSNVDTSRLCLSAAQGKKEFNEKFIGIWDGIPFEQRRAFVWRLWEEYLRPALPESRFSDVNNIRNTSSILGLIELREFVRVRALPLNEEWRYGWLLSSIALILQDIGRNQKMSYILDICLNSPKKTSIVSKFLSAPRLLQISGGDAKSEVMHILKVSNKDQINITYNVDNRTEFAVPVWIGADLQSTGTKRTDKHVVFSSNPHYYFNAEEDISAVAYPGKSLHTRHLTIASSWPRGIYLLDTAIWYGEKSQTEFSVRFAAQNQPLLIQ